MVPAFADNWPEKWPLGEAPCESIYEAGSEVRKLCPAWELCGRVKNQRALVTADVWLGHVLSAEVPRSILGTFSAVRYRQSPEKDGYEIDYLVMDSTPRLLLYRLHEVGRVSVLLASATSWLEPSTEYHVDKESDYMLVPDSDEVGSVRLYVLPKLHP
jgi:hypothetical protein